MRIQPLLPLLATLLIVNGAAAQSSSTTGNSAQAPSLKPYTARYGVKYRGMSGGEIEFTLKSEGNGRYVFSSHLLPNFLGSLFASDQAEDSSQILLDESGLRPVQFHSEDGSKNTGKDISYQFDWSRNSVAGRYEDSDFTLTLPRGTQDRLSIQLAASLALQAGREPGKLTMLEKNELQEYTIVQQGTEQVNVAAGSYDAAVLKSERTGSSRSTRYWYAPKLGYIPVRAERSSKGKVDIVMELKSYKAL
ncbi:MAG: DUF3108 domain-containing protein [Steroidobacteraceae bacterium]